ncbi:MAG: MerR family transcriptional regulator [Lachnospiraceae bacterium]|jgi:DNA-binding transcriptional MerR regulator|nr:MerR family transcriptional regulator [Lachnospiraceae bacterium]
MNEIHYLISDASKKVDVEAHVLRYWEEELKLDIPRNEMGHRYYTELHIRLFRQVKALKDRGYQLKAIKSALDRVMESGSDLIISDEVLEEDMEKALKECAAVSEQTARTGRTCVSGPLAGREPLSGGVAGSGRKPGKEKIVELAADGFKDGEDLEELSALPEAVRENMPSVNLTTEEKMEQFQEIMNHIIGRALDANNEKLSQDISHMVNDKVTQEMESLFRMSDEKEEERFRQLDEIIRSYQKDNRSREEAAATKVPFFKRKRFGKKKNQ